MAIPPDADDRPGPAPGAAQSLSTADERMSSVVNHVVDGIISIDEAGTIVTFNPAA